MRGTIFLIILLAGCSAAGERQELVRSPNHIISDTFVGTMQGAWVAVQMPFEDLNLKRQDIPEKLQRIADHPYALPPQMLCESIRREIAELDVLLGPDVCTIDNPTGTAARAGYAEQGADMVQEQAIGLARSQADIIPLRGVVRKISGAEKHAREVERAYHAGRLRRAFLKGLGASLGPECLKLMATPQSAGQNLH